MDLVRQEIISNAKLVVIKVGTRVLTTPEGLLNLEQVASLSEQMNWLIQQGRQVVLVSSGAVGAGMSHLGITKRPADLAKLQAVAAIGQTKLMEAYDRFLSRQHQRSVGQVLLTAEDLTDRSRYLNVRNTLFSLLEMGAVPIINENDTVAVDELQTTFGDNDRLAALVTNLLRASLLIILSDVDGLYDGHPNNAGSNRIATVTEINAKILSFAAGHQIGLSKGGMSSKLKAAQTVTSAGENVILASGRTADVIKKIFQQEPLGTTFLAQGKSVSPFKRWLGFSAQVKGKLILDTGASTAVATKGRSLLAIGVTQITGAFAKGDVVAVCDAAGHEIARGLTNYTSSDLAKIIGHRSADIAEILGHLPYEEVIHRDNMFVISNGA